MQLIAITPSAATSSPTTSDTAITSNNIDQVLSSNEASKSPDSTKTPPNVKACFSISSQEDAGKTLSKTAPKMPEPNYRASINANDREATVIQVSNTKAGSHNDNEEFPFYQDYCVKKTDKFDIPYQWNISERYIIKVMHPDSSSAFNKLVTIADCSGKPVFRAKTQASGEIVIFPRMDFKSSDSYKINDYTIAIDNNLPTPINNSLENRISLMANDARQIPAQVPVQVCFLMDATGSMADEIQQLQDVIFSIYSRITALPTRPLVEFSIVSYRDKKDVYLVRGTPFTGSIDDFQVALGNVTASGGGDYPEDVEAGFAFCLDSLRWKSEAVKFIFLVGDAPPHLKEKERNYLALARQCRENGIMISPIGASGLSPAGEFVFRQMGVLTHGEFVFLHYGEQGESDGAATAADPGRVSHHTGSNYTVRRLDDIVLDIVGRELAYLTPVENISHNYPKPQEQAELLDVRLANLLRQVVRDDNTLAGKALVIPPVSVADTSLNQVSEYLWELALEKLPSLTKASVIERGRLQDILKELAISQTGITEPVDENKIGKLLNADYLLLSRLHYLGAVRVCHMRLVDCKSGSIISAARVQL
jgi:hypothetical protein